MKQIMLVLIAAMIGSNALAGNPFKPFEGSYNLISKPKVYEWNVGECNLWNIRNAVSIEITPSTAGVDLFKLIVKSSVNGRTSVAEEVLGNTECGSQCYRVAHSFSPGLDANSSFIPNGTSSRYTRSVEIEYEENYHTLRLFEPHFDRNGEKNGLCYIQVSVQKN